MLGLTIYLVFETAATTFAPDLEIQAPYWNYGLFYEPLKVLPFGLGDLLMETLGYEVEGEDEEDEEEYGDDDEDGEFEGDDDEEEEE